MEYLLHEYDDYKLVLVGHSLGGALTPLVGNEFANRNRQVTAVSFGSPKFGNEVNGAMVEGNAYIRVTHVGDIVPLLPTRQLGYSHAGLLMFFQHQRATTGCRHHPNKGVHKEELDPRGCCIRHNGSNTSEKLP
ncbi:Lipase [Pichia kudriavzevii]|uniref:triacylglycerol lipase n=1 Tax=Pichia kudriavzevii TaxID=4909 RepID=A0A1V2LSI8_PICKU|nr:Lipase [Pichia kudriavzevii]